MTDQKQLCAAYIYLLLLINLFIWTLFALLWVKDNILVPLFSVSCFKESVFGSCL